MQNLTDLLASDLSKADDETLLAGIRDAEMTYAKAQEWSGKLIAELKRRGTLSWPAIARETGVPHPTLIRRAKPYLPDSATTDG